MDYGLERKRIAVAGGCGGIGRALVSALLAEGARPIVFDLPQSLEKHPLPSGVYGYGMDARNRTDVEQAFSSCAAEHEALDGLVNLVGYASEKAPISDYSEDAWQDVLDGNLNSAFHICRAAIPLLRKGSAPAIVNISSGLALKPTPGYGPYSVSKAGVLAMTRLIAQECAPYIRANAVAPSAVDTAFLRGGTGRGGDENGQAVRLDMEAYLHTVPLQRLAQPDDIVGPILFLLSTDAAYVTGQTLHVNGGMLMV